MNLEDVVLNETSQSPEDKHYVIPLLCGTCCSQIHGHREQDGGCRVGGEGNGSGRLMGAAVPLLWEEMSSGGEWWRRPHRKVHVLHETELYS